MKIDNVIIPPAYERIAQEEADTLSEERVRYFVRREGRKRVGPFRFDPQNPEYVRLREELHRHQRRVHEELEQLFEQRSIPFRARGSGNPQTLWQTGRRKLVLLMRPPFFSSNVKDKGACRMRQRPAHTNVNMHWDEGGNLHTVRWHRHSVEQPDTAQLLDIFGNALATNLIQSQSRLEEAFTEQDWAGFARTVAQRVNTLYQDMKDATGRRNWHVTRPPDARIESGERNADAFEHEDR